jgi:hypothetical protein
VAEIERTADARGQCDDVHGSEGRREIEERRSEQDDPIAVLAVEGVEKQRGCVELLFEAFVAQRDRPRRLAAQARELRQQDWAG